MKSDCNFACLIALIRKRDSNDSTWVPTFLGNHIKPVCANVPNLMRDGGAPGKEIRNEAWNWLAVRLSRIGRLTCQEAPPPALPFRVDRLALFKNRFAR